MATTEYQCTICKRFREIVDNDRGLTVTTKCTITQACRGSLVVTKRLLSTFRETKPATKESLVDWQQRNVLWDHTQKISSAKWRIPHTLNVPFTVDVSIRDGLNVRELTHTEFEVENTEQNLATITFAQPHRGVAQLIARNGSKHKVFDTPTEDQIVQVSQHGRLIILDASSPLTSGTATVKIQLISPDGTVYTGDQTITIDGLDRTSWSVPGVLYNDISEMKVFNLRLADLFITPAIGALPDGMRLVITEVFGRAPKRHEIMVAMTYDASRNDPFNRVKDKLVDVSSLKSGLIIRKNEVYVYHSDIELVSPPLRIL